MATLVAKFPNLRYHVCDERIELFNPTNGALLPNGQIYAQLRDLRHSSIILDNSRHFNSNMNVVATHFPSLTSLKLEGENFSCVEAVTFFPNLRRLKLDLQRQSHFSLQQFQAIVSLEKLKTLTIED